MVSTKRDLGAEILDGLREIRQGEIGRAIHHPRSRWLGSHTLALGLAIAAPQVAAAGEPATFEALLHEGQELLSKKDCAGAVKAFRKAEKLAPGPSYDLFDDTSRAYICLGAWKDAETYARRAVDLAAEPVQKAEAYNRLGQTLFRSGVGNEQQMADAAAAFRQALAVSEGRLPMVRYNLAEALLKLGQDEEGVALLRELLAAWPDAPMAARAKSLIANPLRARVPMLPDFDIVTLDGQHMTAEDLKGKVVLLDFWATWCAPCRAAVPELQRWSGRSATEPFVVLSVSSDYTAESLRQFVAAKGMTWPQFHDARGDFDQQFDVQGLPTYVLADHTGVILHRASGWSPTIQAELARRISKAIKEAKKADAAPPATGALDRP